MLNIQTILPELLFICLLKRVNLISNIWFIVHWPFKLFMRYVLSKLHRIIYIDFKTGKQAFSMQHYIFVTINISWLPIAYLPANQGENMVGICTLQCAAANLTDLICCLTPRVIKNVYIQKRFHFRLIFTIYLFLY